MIDVEKSRDGKEVIVERGKRKIITISRNYNWDIDRPAINLNEYTEKFPEGRPINLFTKTQHEYYLYNSILNQAGIPEERKY